MKVKLGSLRRLIREAMKLETDDRMMGDDAGNGEPDPDNPEDLADHLRDDADGHGIALGDDANLKREMRQFFLQEQEDDKSPDAPAEPTTDDGPTPEPGVAPETMGFYTPFDMTRDHTGTDNPNGTWYRSPGQPVGDHDPFRSADPYAQLGFHPPAGVNDPAASPPEATGEAGADALDAPEDESMKTDNTNDIGANKQDDSVGSDNGSQEKEPAKKQAQS